MCFAAYVVPISSAGTTDFLTETSLGVRVTSTPALRSSRRASVHCRFDLFSVTSRLGVLLACSFDGSWTTWGLWGCQLVAHDVRACSFQLGAAGCLLTARAAGAFKRRLGAGRGWGGERQICTRDAMLVPRVCDRWLRGVGGGKGGWRLDAAGACASVG